MHEFGSKLTVPVFCPHPCHPRLLYLRCAKKSRQDQSALCAACCLLTSLCDTVGAVLARQLTIQVFTGAYLAAVDLVNFMFILFPVCGSKFKSNSDREARERKRRRQLRASVFALALPLSLGPCWALWVAAPKASATIRGPQRRLLASLLQENTEILGYLLGSIAAFGSWASRIPPLSRICRGKTFPSIHLWTRLLSALAGLLYASAIVAHDRQPEYLLRATPWFLTSLGRAALDLAVSTPGLGSALLAARGGLCLLPSLPLLPPSFSLASWNSPSSQGRQTQMQLFVALCFFFFFFF
nr:transmembrane protein 44 isoform X4 [Macaca nemestrina]